MLNVELLTMVSMVKKMRSFILTALLTCSYAICYAQAPAGYYNGAAGLSGSALKGALSAIIKSGHSPIQWASTWTALSTTDAKPNANVWDIYSWKPIGLQPYEYSFGTADQCGNYNGEGDCFNREHTWPQGFFDGTNSGDGYAKTDLHHVFASDGWINNARSNFPFAVVTSGATTYQQGCKLGNGNAYSGYTGKVFEPIDSLKGDIARGLFYVSTRYLNDDGGWQSWPMADGASLTADAIAVLLAWHQLDPVSSKEVDRNNAIYNLQGNRNPFVDEPQYVECIWGTSTICSTLNVNAQVATQKISYLIQNELMTLTGTSTNSTYKIFNLSGNCTMQGETKLPISLSTLPAGVYLMKVRNDKNAQSLLFVK
jgi:endonuclease I